MYFSLALDTGTIRLLNGISYLRIDKGTALITFAYPKFPLISVIPSEKPKKLRHLYLFEGAELELGKNIYVLRIKGSFIRLFSNSVFLPRNLLVVPT